MPVPVPLYVENHQIKIRYVFMLVKKRTNHGDHHIIGNQLAMIDKFFCFYTKRGFVSDLFTKQVAGGKMDKSIFLNQLV